jgi:predicted ferric reductase
MTSNLHKELREARPKLKFVSPLAHAVIFIFGVFNILLGITFLFAIDENKITTSLLIVNDVFTYRFWGIVFILLGVFKIFSLKLNNWSLSRKSLLLGVAIKAAWAIALVVRAVTSPGTWFVAIMWIALAAIQIMTFIYFMPPSVRTNIQPEGRRKL